MNILCYKEIMILNMIKKLYNYLNKLVIIIYIYLKIINRE